MSSYVLSLYFVVVWLKFTVSRVEQLKRWQSGPLTEAQGEEVARLVEQMKKMRENNTKVLELAEELSKGTIEKQMAKSDEQLGMEMLLRMMEGKGL